jgi:hypothetical protein
VSDPSAACVSAIEIFVMPVAGPGDTQVPEMFVLDGVVRDGPHETIGIAATDSGNMRRRKREIEVIEKSEWATRSLTYEHG